MRTKCGEPCEKYSRVCGYFRPVNNWNRGKKNEFADRKVYGWPPPTHKAPADNPPMPCGTPADRGEGKKND